MQYPDPKSVHKVALIGAGTIGGGWALHFLRYGMDVVMYDPAPDVEAATRGRVADIWPTLERLGLRTGAAPERLSFAPSLAAAVSDADFVQENTPERADLKVRVLAEIDAAAPPEVVVASSTSGVLMTDMQRECAHPERCVVAHPFNPTYLMPLVEIVGGRRTAPEAVAWAVEFFELVGKRPLQLDKEYPGFLADRLLEAVWREALHLISEGLASVAEIDAAMMYAPALRWSIMGPCLTYHLGGGEGGMEHFLDLFGPSLNLPWSYMDAPELTPELRSRLVEGTQRLAAGRTVRELELERDNCLIAILEALEKCRMRAPLLVDV